MKQGKPDISDAKILPDDYKETRAKEAAYNEKKDALEMMIMALSGEVGKLFAELDAKDIKLLMRSMPKWEIPLMADMEVNCLKISFGTYFLRAHRSTHYTRLNEALSELSRFITFGAMTEVKRACGVEGDLEFGKPKLGFPKYYYKKDTFSYELIKSCVIRFWAINLYSFTEKQRQSGDNAQAIIGYAKPAIEQIAGQIKKYKRK